MVLKSIIEIIYTVKIIIIFPIEERRTKAACHTNSLYYNALNSNVCFSYICTILPKSPHYYNVLTSFLYLKLHNASIRNEILYKFFSQR